MLSYFATQVDEDMWNIMLADSRDFRVILFSLNASPPSSLSRVINNGLSFVGFNATATPYKAKLYPSWHILSATFYAFVRGSRARRRLLKRALVIALACP